jgi:hypothetical protein
VQFRFGLRGFAAGTLVLLTACTNASPTEEGGDPRFDASPPASDPPPALDSGACGDPNADAGFGQAWSDLYRDYFGPSGIASCAGTAGACHGEPTGLGAQSSNYVCAGGVSGCYDGITNKAAGIVTVGDTTDDPTNSGLYAVLRKACIGGSMPKQPASVTFSPADMKRITGWIGAGAPNN